jgi:hypothetical protein
MIILYGWIDALDLDLPGSAASASSALIHLKSLSILAFFKLRASGVFQAGRLSVQHRFGNSLRFDFAARISAMQFACSFVNNK